MSDIKIDLKAKQDQKPPKNESQTQIQGWVNIFLCVCVCEGGR